MLKSSSMNDTTVRPFHVRAGKSGIRHPAHFYVLSGGLLGNVWGSGWRRWWWLRKIDLLSVPFSFKIIFSIPISRCFSIIFLWQMDKWVAPKPRRCCASVGLSSGLFWFLFFNLVSARPVLSVMVSPVEFVFVCAGLWLLCCSCFGGVSPVQLVLVFVVVVDGFWFRFVSVRPVLSLFWIVCYLYQWSSYIYNRQS